MQGNEITLTDKKLTPADNLVDYIDVPVGKPIQKIYLRVKLTGNSAGTVVAGEDLCAKVLKLVRVLLNDGEKTYFAGYGGSFLRKNFFDYGTMPTNTLITTVSQTGVTLGECMIVFDAMQNPKNPWDISSLITPEKTASLKIEVSLDSGANLGTGYTITGGEIVATIKQMELTPAEKAANIPLELFVLEQKKDIAAASTGLDFVIDTIPTGKMLKRIFLTATLNGVRSDTEVTEFQLVVNDNQVSKWGWPDSKFADKIEYQLESTNQPVGFTALDLESIGGVDLRGIRMGKAVLNSNVGAPTGVTNLRALI
jgi:hypothetical protein